MNRERALRAGVAIAGGWECAAITTGKLPTITATVKWLRRRRWGQAALWAVYGGLTVHFFAAAVAAEVAAEVSGEGA